MNRPQRIIAAVAFAIGFGSALLSAPPDRFDHVVRNDFFAGFAGNAEAFAQAMKVSGEMIAANPDHPEALVWHGAGLYFQGRQLLPQRRQSQGHGALPESLRRDGQSRPTSAQ